MRILHTLLLCSALSAPAADFNSVKSVLEDRCLDCHDSDDAKGNLNIEELLKSRDFTGRKSEKQWIKIEHAVTKGEMPPKKKKPLQKAQKNAVEKWFRQEFVLRKEKEHIGPSTLRRLTRYEIENTLSDLLSVQLKNPYVYSPEFPSFQPSTLESILPRDIQGESGYFNDAAQLQASKFDLLKMIEAADYALRVFKQNENAQKKLLGKTLKQLSSSEASQSLQKFAASAFRDYQNPHALKVLEVKYNKYIKKNSPGSALLQAMQQTLLSPAFIYRFENVKGSSEPYDVTGSELAVRLAYFLWSSMPDKELSALGRSGELLKMEILDKQIKRMLNSPKRLALSENFAGQWLGFINLKTNKIFFKNEKWNRGIYDELLFSFDELIKSDRSILEIIDADWIYKSGYTNIKIRGGKTSHKNKYNDILAIRYKKPPGRKEKFYSPPRIMSVKDDRLGGMLTSGGIMRLTSAPDRTSPIRRGVWLMGTVIGKHLEAPENVPPLSESSVANGKKLTRLADILEAHTSKAVCRSCHQHIDPLGLGLENFSPEGDWRTKYKNKQNVISKGVLPNGKTFKTPKEMKKALLEFYKESIVENIIRQMFSYALGREIRPYDRIAVESISKKMASQNYRMSVLITEIIKSRQFLQRQDK